MGKKLDLPAMIKKLLKVPRQYLRKTGFDFVRIGDPAVAFRTDHYLRHNARRLEHLASLRIPVAGLSVLDVGAGIGDHAEYYIDRGCDVTISDARPDNLRIAKKRYPGLDVRLLDLDRPGEWHRSFDVVHCYGVLYHLAKPAEALAFLARLTRRFLLLETCVAFGDDQAVHPTPEVPIDPTQAGSGSGCRPTRPWVFNELRRHFAHVYLPRTQPNHEEFPLDWSRPAEHRAPLQRAIFIASRDVIGNDALVPHLPTHQERHP